MLDIIKDCFVVKSKAHLKAYTETAKLRMIEKYPRNKKRKLLKIDKPIGKPSRIDISGLFCPFVTINTIIPRISASKNISINI